MMCFFRGNLKRKVETIKKYQLQGFLVVLFLLHKNLGKRLHTTYTNEKRFFLDAVM